MPDILALRERAIDLVERLRDISGALDRLEAVTLVLTPAMQLHTAPKQDDEEDDYDIERLRGHEGERYPLFSSQVLLSIIGYGDVADRESRTFQSNALYHIRAMRAATSDLPRIETGPEPDLDSLTRFEVVGLVEAYKAVIQSSTEALLDAHYNIGRLRENRSPLPDYVKGACIGMFGQPDRETLHRYSENDFKRHNRREEPILPFEKGYVEGRNLTRTVDERPRVFSARYLAPMFGDDVAEGIESAVEAIAAAAAPRPGDPKPHPRWSSFDREPVVITYAPGEVEVDEAHGLVAPPRP